jgi:hypothetical protein
MTTAFVIIGKPCMHFPRIALIVKFRIQSYPGFDLACARYYIFTSQYEALPDVRSAGALTLSTGPILRLGRAYFPFAKRPSNTRANQAKVPGNKRFIWSKILPLTP